ncbi:unnamed protein product [Effrenium voratum]|nr:unnamed protein product [Effrenium voratum]
MMVAELKGVSDIMARMQLSCYSKCIANVKEEKLSVGEMSCVDRLALPKCQETSLEGCISCLCKVMLPLLSMLAKT